MNRSSSKSWILGAAGAALLGGILLGLLVNLGPASNPPTPTLAIDEIVIGIPGVMPQEGAVWNASSRLLQKRNYTTADPLALRVVSHAASDRAFTLSVRLLEEDGTVQTLSPATITVNGGTSGYCCWTITKPGEYKLQLLAQDQAPLLLPITIVAAPKNVSPVRLKQ